MKRAATAADRRAHVVVVAKPSSSTTAPPPAMNHHPGLAACPNSAKSACEVACEPDTTMAPVIATPSAEPIWRLVEAVAAATPACASGMPDTAVLVIGGFTIVKPKPNSAYASATQVNGVAADSPVSSTPAAVRAIPPVTSDSRGPCAAT